MGGTNVHLQKVKEMIQESYEKPKTVLVDGANMYTYVLVTWWS